MEYPRQDLDEALKGKLVALALRLLDQEAASVLVTPQRDASGFWFGGGNVIRDRDGTVFLVGRYRNQGDSRTGLGAGERGLELAIFGGSGFFGPLEKLKAFSKEDLRVGEHGVLSIEGTCLHLTANGVELYVSSEKDLAYPEMVQKFQKPGTGVWSIDRIVADRVTELRPTGIEPLLASDTPATLHVKDPVVFDLPDQGTAMIYCTHPFAWSSSNTGVAVWEEGKNTFSVVSDSMLPRGFVWDVAATRVTERLPVPRVGAFKHLPPLSLYFYDGAECLRPHEQHAKGVKRPRGYSCEEIGGLAWGFDADFPLVQRLSVNCAFFVAPYGTGCSRYVSALVTEEGIYACWQQSQPDLSQPLVGHWLPMDEVTRVLA